jgi:AraC-like DNA-binding protein
MLRPVEVPPASPTEVVSIQLLAKGGRWRTEAMRSYHRPVLIWFTRGQGRLSVAGRTTGYSAHSAVFLPAGTMHGFSVPPATLGFVVYLPPEHGGAWPTEARHIRLREVQQQRELTAMIDAIERETLAGAPEAAQAVAHHTGLLAIWFGRTLGAIDRADPPAKRDSAETLTAAYTALVEKEFRRNVGVKNLAARLGVTPTHLSRVTRKVAGRAALDILAERRHFEACHLLASGSLPVATIARQTGFSSAAYFTRAFRAKAGQSPSDFRAANPDLKRHSHQIA